ncbi:organic cation transporter-like protein, partial [Diaphorina citri]|uniref:Organic cation transporter-like protein n=1 Tax=Diaphorina citri TaxID=121845 RepID=A0A3Q0JJN4_DIACI
MIFIVIFQFDLHCNENKWKLTAVGTLSIVARILGMPLTAFVSDRFGRRYVIIFGTILSCLFGTLRALSPNYETFLAFELLDAFFAAGFYHCAVVLGVELISPSKRIWATIIINCAYTVGDIFLGTVGYYFRYWRHFLLVIYLPGAFFISYFWIFPESIRWLVSMQRYDEAAKIIEKMARWNNVKLDFDIKEALSMSKSAEEKSKEPQLDYCTAAYLDSCSGVHLVLELRTKHHGGCQILDADVQTSHLLILLDDLFVCL